MAARRRGSAHGSLLGLAVGDCLGAAVEGAHPATIATLHGTVTDYLHDPVVWTDDTQQALVLVESVVRYGGLDPSWIARRYVEMRRAGGGPFGLHRRTGRGFRNSVEDFERTGDPRTSGRRDRAGNGAAMRIAPAAVALSQLDDEEFSRQVVEASLITHREIQAVAGALAVARTAALLASEGERRPPEALLAELVDWLDERRAWLASDYGDVLDRPEVGERFVDALGGVRDRWGDGWAAIIGWIEDHAARYTTTQSFATAGFVLCSVVTSIALALDNAPDLVGAVVHAVNMGGDADTVGAMVGGMVGAVAGPDGIPARWKRMAGWDALHAWGEALGHPSAAVELPDLVEVEEELNGLIYRLEPE